MKEEEHLGATRTPTQSRNAYLRRNAAKDINLPEFMRATRATVMPVVSAAGDTGPPLLVFRGARLPFR